MLRRLFGKRGRGEEYYDPMKGLEEDLAKTGMTVREAKFVSRFCRMV